MDRKRPAMELGLVALLWVLLLTLPPLGYNVDWPTVFWVKQIFFATLLTSVYYLNKQYLLPGLFSQNKYRRYVLVALVIVALTLVLMQVFEWQIGLPRKMHELFRPDEPFNPERRYRWRFDYSGFLLLLIDFSMGVIIYLIQKTQEEASRRRELEKLQISTELSYLKAQINPHFFFNTLNNIYALTSLNVDASREALLKLSSMMRYVIYERKTKTTSLSEEIEFIENYIELMKLRMSKRVTVVFNRPENPPELSIAPMILLPFVENAFKHGVSSKDNTNISIDISLSGSRLEFKVENTKVIRENESHEKSTGIGISNTRRRLELLYPDKHHFELDDQGDTFSVLLRIDLK